MADKAVVYSKSSGQPRIPLTVRIDWMPDGKIIPRMYWTPDGTCHRITSLCEGVPLAFLKERGAGLRFKACAEIVETPEDDDRMHTQVETYLYLADSRFCQRNIIDARYGHAGKEYVRVTLDVFPDGGYELVYFWYHDERYIVEKPIATEPRGAYHAGGVGILHKVEARLVSDDDDDDPDPQNSVSRLAALFWELDKWFVAVKNTA